MAEKVYPYPPAGLDDPGGSDVIGYPPAGSARQRCNCPPKLPAILQALVRVITGDLRPAGGWDTQGALFGLGQSEGSVPLQATSWFGSTTDRDRGPMPMEVILPVAMLGDNPIPLETPVYYRGSLWRDDAWERGT
jgi:hypothetical protein